MTTYVSIGTNFMHNFSIKEHILGKFKKNQHYFQKNCPKSQELRQDSKKKSLKLKFLANPLPFGCLKNV